VLREARIITELTREESTSFLEEHAGENRRHFRISLNDLVLTRRNSYGMTPN
jgi:hypothetical protein